MSQRLNDEKSAPVDLGNLGQLPLRHSDLEERTAAEGLAAVAAGRPRGRSLHCGAADSEPWPARCDPRQARAHDDQLQGGAEPARSRQPAIPDAKAEFALWVSDFTCVATWSGFVYVAFVVDAHARRFVGWRVSRTAHAGFVLDAPEQALPNISRMLVRHPLTGTDSTYKLEKLGSSSFPA